MEKMWKTWLGKVAQQIEIQRGCSIQMMVSS
jgi:hypothetical protein